MKKEEFNNIEKEFCGLFGIEIIKDHSIKNKYSVDTVNGPYSVWFDKTPRYYSIFGRFEDMSLVNNFVKEFKINPHSGKMNFHGNHIYDFIDTMEAVKP